MLDHLVDLLGRKQPPVPALMPGLTTTTPTRPLPTRTRRRRRRILRGRKRRVPRTPAQPPLELNHPSLEPLVRLDQLAHPQQQRDSRLAIAIKDLLGLSPLHTTRFAALDSGPSFKENAYLVCCSSRRPLARLWQGLTRSGAIDSPERTSLSAWCGSQLTTESLARNQGTSRQRPEWAELGSGRQLSDLQMVGPGRGSGPGRLRMEAAHARRRRELESITARLRRR
jgi:hypothetical protein